MKTIEQFLSDLYRQEVQLWAEGDRLRCNAPEAVLTEDLSAQLRARKAEILAFLQQNETNAAAAIQPVPRTGPLPVSFAQQRLWFLEQMQQEGAVYNIPLAVQVQGWLDEAAFSQSLNALVQRHEALRTRFITVEGQPVQEVVAPEPIAIEQRDLRQASPAEQEAEVRQQAIASAQTRFDLTQAPLLRVTLLRLKDAESVVLLTLHHIIADGWSMEVLLRELGLLYRAHLTGADPALPALPIQYGDFAVWQRQWLQGAVLERQLGYWQKQLSGTLPVLQLPTDFPRARVQTFRGAVENFALSAELSDGLKALAQQQSTTLFVTLLTAFKVLLFRYTGQRDLLVGTPIANRNRAEVEGLIGFFVNTLVLRTSIGGASPTHLTPQATFLELLEQLKTTTYQAYEHQDLPFEKLVEALQPERDLSYNPLFQVKFRLENAPQQAISLPGLTLKPLPQAYSAAKLDLSVDLYETAEGIVGGFEYNRDLFEADTIRRLVGHFQTLLASIAANPYQPIAELPLLTAVEQHQQLIAWNDTQTPYHRDRCFHHLFEAQEERTPDAIALVFDGPESQQLTYAELDHRSNQLAHHLQSLGVGPEVIVGICLERSPDMIVAMLAVLKAGGAYLPLDPAYPPERLAFMLEDSQAAVLITSSALLANGLMVGSAHPTIVDLTSDLDTITHLPSLPPTLPSLHPSALAYLIYTSGSTGTPKGVLVPHSGLTNLTEDKIRVCDVRPGDCVLQFFSFSFDASIPEIVMALATGARLLLAPNETLLPGPGLADLLRRHHVTHITITPSALVSVPYGDFPDLRMVLVGGEAPSPELIHAWSQGRRFINAYGPTETTVNASMVPCGNGQPVQPTLRPSANKQLYILDNQLQLLPIGAIGELHIGGTGLARGYLNRPELTAEKFVPNPWERRSESALERECVRTWERANFEENHQPTNPPTHQPINASTHQRTNAPTHQRTNPSTHPPIHPPTLYKTGDLACYLPDGRIKLLGRIDDQAKIRGFRVEPAEIENQLNQHPDVKASVVLVREDVPGDKRLIAYVVKAERAWERGSVGAWERGGSSPTHPPAYPSTHPPIHPSTPLRQFLSDKLPHYLIPSVFVELEALPLTPNGKVDVRSLPAPTLESPEVSYVAPRSEVEIMLADIFAQVLGVERVGIHDDFFELGGHSLLATQLVAQVLNHFDVEVTVIDLFEATTVAALAQRIEQKQLLVQIQTRPLEDDADREEFAL